MSEIMKPQGPADDTIRDFLMGVRNGSEDISILSTVPPENMLRAIPALMKDFKDSEIRQMYGRYVGAILSSADAPGELPAGHPLRTLRAEDRLILIDAGELAIHAGAPLSENRWHEGMKSLLSRLRLVGLTRYNRVEMILFPYLERKGIGAVVTSIWRSHDMVRDGVRNLGSLVHRDWNDNKERAAKLATNLSVNLADVAMREEQLLLPTASALLSEGEWVSVRNQEDAIGYYGVEPEEWKTDAQPVPAYEAGPEITDEQMALLPPHVRSILKSMTLVGDYYDFRREGDLKLNSGYLLLEEVDAVLNHLPVDITFIDADDRVRFFSGESRIFSRTESVLGRMVWFCHPPKSVSTVERILESFKNGKKDAAEFWIRMNGRLIHIRYFAVRDRWGDYIGTLEMVQDITDIQKIEGERRLLDWDE